MTAGMQQHKRTKHIALRYHYVRKLIRDGIVTVKYQPTAQQPADLFTKQLARTLFNRHADVVMGNCTTFRMGQYPSDEYPVD